MLSLVLLPLVAAAQPAGIFEAHCTANSLVIAKAISRSVGQYTSDVVFEVIHQFHPDAPARTTFTLQWKGGTGRVSSRWSRVPPVDRPLVLELHYPADPETGVVDYNALTPKFFNRAWAQMIPKNGVDAWYSGGPSPTHDTLANLQATYDSQCADPGGGE